MINRRNFISAVGAAGLTIAASSALAAPVRSRRFRRLSVSSPSFRHLFVQTNPKATAPITLEDFPRFVRDELGLPNVEIWSMHFDDLSPEYCRRLRAAVRKAGSNIVNVQLDDPAIDLAHPDLAERARSVATVKQWMDRAAICGSPNLRTNVNLVSKSRPGELEAAAESFRDLARYGRNIGVRVLAENHVGFTASVDNTIALVRSVNDPWCRAIADWGNSPAPNDSGRVADIARLMPYTALVSAKGIRFDQVGVHQSYDQAALVKSAEQSGFRGIYSVELYGPPPADSVAAARNVIRTIADNLKSG